jgi:hypothetical protein
MKSFYAYGTKINLVFAALVLAALALFSGCATTPGADTSTLSRVALKSVTTIAVGRVVERDNATPEQARARAERITAIALTLQGLGDDALSTLPLVMDALKPLVDKAGLTSLERMQADILIEALTAAALQRIDLDKNPTYATIRLVLDDVIRAAAYYLPPAESRID